MLRAPDVEGAVIAALTAAGFVARDVLVPPWPSLRVARVGGTRRVIADQALIQIDCAAGQDGSKSGTLSTLEAAIATLRDAEGSTVADVVLSAVQVFATPAYLPDAQTGAPRYTATLSITSRALVPQTP